MVSAALQSVGSPVLRLAAIRAERSPALQSVLRPEPWLVSPRPETAFNIVAIAISTVASLKRLVDEACINSELRTSQ